MASGKPTSQNVSGDPSTTMLSRLPRSGVLVLAVLVIAVGVSFLRDQHDELPAPPPTPVHTARVQHAREYTFTQNYTGRIEARRSSELSFEHHGRLVAVQGVEGQTVQVGDVIAQLDADSLGAERSDYEARRAAADARLQELVRGPRLQTIAQAQAELQSAEASLQRLIPRYKRILEAFAQNAASQDEADEATFEKRNAEALFELAKQKLDELKAGSRPEQIQAQRAEVKALDARIALVELQIKNSTLRAPFTGRLGRLTADIGTVLQPGQPIAKIIEDTRLEAWVGLPPRIIPQLKTGQTYPLTVGDVQHRVSFVTVMPQLDNRTRTVQAVFALEPQDEQSILPGQIARLQIPQTIEQPGFWLPTDALIKGHRGLWATYVVQPSPDEPATHTAVYTDIELLYTQGDRAFVRGILSDGQRIIAAGAERIAPGSPVTPSELPATANADPPKPTQ